MASGCRSDNEVSTVGAATLGNPIIEGLSAYNTAYALQGAILIGLLRRSGECEDELREPLRLIFRREVPGMRDLHEPPARERAASLSPFAIG